MSTRPLPPALEAYFQLPPETSLLLLTSTLGCSVNWLTCRFIANILSLFKQDGQDEEQPPLMLISWLHDFTFWKTEVRRTTGIDLTRHSKTFVFVDCFSQHRHLKDTEDTVVQALDKFDGGKSPLLILDHPDILLATAAATSVELNVFLLRLRSLSSAAVVTCAADLPLISAASSGEGTIATPIELESATFITTQAHAAQRVLSVRELETGAARDVSGVLRITKGGAFYEFEEEFKEAEMLYLIQRDGNAKVFRRGDWS